MPRRRATAQRVDRVGQKIDDHLLELDRVSLDREEIRIEAPADDDLVHAEAVGHEVHRAAHHVVEIDPADLALRGADKAQQSAQQFRRAPCLSQDLLHLAALLLRDRRVGDAVLGVRGDRHEGVIDLVRYPRQQLARRGEATLLLGAIAQHPRHFVEMLRQPRQLVGAGYRDLGRQVPVGDACEPRLEIGEGAPHAAANERDGGRDAHRAQDEPQDCVAQHLAGGQLQHLLPSQQIPARQLAFGEHLLVDDLSEAVEGAHSPACVVPAAALEQRDLLGERVPEARHRILGARQRDPERQGNGGVRSGARADASGRDEVPDGVDRVGGGGRARLDEMPHDGAGVVERVVAASQVVLQSDDCRGPLAESQRRGAHAKEEVEGQDAGIEPSGERHQQQRGAEAHGLAGGASHRR